MAGGGSAGGGGISFGTEIAVGTPVVDNAESTGWGTGASINTAPLITLPTTSKYYVLSAVEWKNGNAPNGNIIGVALLADGDPPVADGCIIAGQTPSTAQSGASTTQKVSATLNGLFIPGGTRVWPGLNVKSTNVDLRYLSGGANQNRGTTVNDDSPLGIWQNGAWAASTLRLYIQLYFKPVL